MSAKLHCSSYQLLCRKGYSMLLYGTSTLATPSERLSLQDYFGQGFFPGPSQSIQRPSKITAARVSVCMCRLKCKFRPMPFVAALAVYGLEQDTWQVVCARSSWRAPIW